MVRYTSPKSLKKDIKGTIENNSSFETSFEKVSNNIRGGRLSEGICRLFKACGIELNPELLLGYHMQSLNK